MSIRRDSWDPLRPWASVHVACLGHGGCKLCVPDNPRNGYGEGRDVTVPIVWVLPPPVRVGTP